VNKLRFETSAQTVVVHGLLKIFQIWYKKDGATTCCGEIAGANDENAADASQSASMTWEFVNQSETWYTE